ncbi:MAG: hypothetical protein J6Y78_11000 [Paludibacteraceae bacterium]|nr:hypothetical protein [Paludibacteraceae bacterium]
MPPAKSNPKDTSEMGSADRWLTENIYNPFYKASGLDYFVVPTSSEDSGNTDTQTQKQSKNTFDWTDVLKLYEDSIEKPYSIDKLATSEVTHVIPYLEVYRTDEVLFRPYISPYLSTSNNTSDSGEDSDSSSEDSDSSSDGSSTEESSNNTNTNSNTTPAHSSLKKNEKLSKELEKVVKKFFKKSVNVSTMVKRYMECDTNKWSILSITNHSKVWLINGLEPLVVTEAVYVVKRKYS